MFVLLRLREEHSEFLAKWLLKYCGAKPFRDFKTIVILIWVMLVRVTEVLLLSSSFYLHFSREQMTKRETILLLILSKSQFLESFETAMLSCSNG